MGSPDAELVRLLRSDDGRSPPYQTTILRQFSGLHLDRLSDETTTLSFRRLLENQELAGGNFQIINGYLGDHGLILREGTVVDMTIIHSPSSA